MVYDRKKGKYEKCSLGQVIQEKVICFCYFKIRHTASIYASMTGTFLFRNGTL